VADIPVVRGPADPEFAADVRNRVAGIFVERNHQGSLLLIKLGLAACPAARDSRFRPSVFDLLLGEVAPELGPGHKGAEHEFAYACRRVVLLLEATKTDPFPAEIVDQLD
jgi:hypothetical protein